MFVVFQPLAVNKQVSGINRVEKSLRAKRKSSEWQGLPSLYLKNISGPSFYCILSIQCFKPVCSRAAHKRLAAGVLDTVLQWYVCSSATGHWHTRPHKHSLGFLHTKGTSSPFSEEVTSLGRAFGDRRAVCITWKPNSCHPDGWHNIPFQTVDMGQDNPHLFHTKHSDSKQQITP